MVDLRELEMRDLEGRVAQATAALSGRQDKNKDAELELLRLQDENKKLIDENKLMKNWLQTMIRLIEQHDEASPISQADVDGMSASTEDAAAAQPAGPAEAPAATASPPSQPAPKAETPSQPQAQPAPPTSPPAVEAAAPAPPMPPDVPAGQPNPSAPPATAEALPVTDPAPAPTAPVTADAPPPNPAPDAADANLVASMRSQHQVDYSQVVEGEAETKSLLGKIKMRLNGPQTQNG